MSTLIPTGLCFGFPVAFTYSVKYVTLDPDNGPPDGTISINQAVAPQEMEGEQQLGEGHTAQHGARVLTMQSPGP